MAHDRIGTSVESAMFYLAPATILCAECGSHVMAGPPSNGAIGQQVVFCPNKPCSMYGRAFLVELEAISGVYTSACFEQNVLGHWIPSGIAVNQPGKPTTLIALPGGKGGN